MKLKKRLIMLFSAFFSLLGLCLGINQKSKVTYAGFNPGGFNLVSISLANETKVWQVGDVVTFDDILVTWTEMPPNGPTTTELVSEVSGVYFSFAPLTTSMHQVDLTNLQTEFVLEKGENEISLYNYPSDAPANGITGKLTISIPNVKLENSVIIDAHLKDGVIYGLGDEVTKDDVYVKISDGTKTFEGLASDFCNDNFIFGFLISYDGETYNFYHTCVIGTGINNIDIGFFNPDVADSDIHFNLVYDAKILVSIEADVPSNKIYFAGDAFTAKDILITAHFADESLWYDNTGNDIVSSIDTVALGENKITLSYTYNGVTKSTTVTIIGLSKVTSITATLTTVKVWKAGEFLKPTDFKVIPHYSDGSTGDPITDGTGVEVLPALLNNGTNNVRIQYTENGISVTSDIIAINAQAVTTAEELASQFNKDIKGETGETILYSIIFKTGDNESVVSSKITLDDIISEGAEYIDESTLDINPNEFILTPNGLSRFIGSYCRIGFNFSELGQVEATKVEVICSIENLYEDNRLYIYMDGTSITKADFDTNGMESLIFELNGKTAKGFKYQQGIGANVNATFNRINVYGIGRTGGLCDSTGENSNLTAIKTAWESANSSYNALSSTEKAKFSNSSNSEIQEMVQVYDYIYGKYHETLELNDFLNRKPVEFAYKNRFIKDKHQSSSIPVILAISIISISSIGVLLAFKKRKDN